MNTIVRTLASPEELQAMADLLQTVWGTPAPIVNFEMLTAIAHSGGYVAAAFLMPATDDATPEIRSEDRDQRDDDSEIRSGPADSTHIRSEDRGERDGGSEIRRGPAREGTMVGASLGLLARHGGRAALHSHVTGLLPAARGTGWGRSLKLHQREWALERGIDVITWTFDPLVRRNAWFNIAVLGADVDQYLPSFYGVMNDAINAGDESDRLHVVWDLAQPVPTSPRDGSMIDDTILVPTPDDIVTLRRTDPVAVARWRTATRDALATALEEGRPIVGFTRDGNYVIGSTP